MIGAEFCGWKMRTDHAAFNHGKVGAFSYGDFDELMMIQADGDFDVLMLKCGGITV